MRVFFVFSMLFATVAVTPAMANCGPFGIWEDNDYCINCADRTWKENSCPGGEAGIVAEGVLHPNCHISYYSPDTCHIRGGAASLTKEEVEALVRKGYIKPTASHADAKQREQYNASHAE